MTLTKRLLYQLSYIGTPRDAQPRTGYSTGRQSGSTIHHGLHLAYPSYQRKEALMLYTIIVVIVILLLLGFVFGRGRFM